MGAWCSKLQFSNIFYGIREQDAHDDDDDDDSNRKMGFHGGNIHIFKSKEDWDANISEANKNAKIVVVNFSSAWSGPCRVMAPIYVEFSTKYPALCYLTVDVDELSDFSSSWDIRAAPTFYFLKDKGNWINWLDLTSQSW